MVFHCIFLGKKAIIITSKQGTRIFFPLESYSKKTLRKNVPKSGPKYKRNVIMPPRHPIILLKLNWIEFLVRSQASSSTMLDLFFVQFELKFRTASEGKFDNAEQPYKGKFLLLSGTSTTLGLSQAQRLFVQAIISN